VLGGHTGLGFTVITRATPYVKAGTASAPVGHDVVGRVIARRLRGGAYEGDTENLPFDRAAGIVRVRRDVRCLHIATGLISRLDEDNRQQRQWIGTKERHNLLDALRQAGVRGR
jgi:hypothetical protein